MSLLGRPPCHHGAMTASASIAPVFLGATWLLDGHDHDGLVTLDWESGLAVLGVPTDEGECVVSLPLTMLITAMARGSGSFMARMARGKSVGIAECFVANADGCTLRLRAALHDSTLPQLEVRIVPASAVALLEQARLRARG